MILIETDDYDSLYCGVFETQELAVAYCCSREYVNYSVYQIKLNTDEREHLFNVRRGVISPLESHTTPREYTAALKRLMELNPLHTIADIAKVVCKSESWVKEYLNLGKIDDEPQPTIVEN